MNSNSSMTMVVIAAALLAGCGQSAQEDTKAERGVVGRAEQPVASGAAADQAADPAATANSAASAAPSAAAQALPLPKVDDSEPKDEPALDLSAPLRIKRLVLSRAVENREPVGPATSFQSGTAKRLYAFVEVGNPQKARSEIYVSFVPPSGQAHTAIRLRIGQGSRWRTWAFTRLAKDPGSWQVVVRNAAGQELAKQSFEIAEQSPQA